MEYMFAGASAFNGDLSGWDVSKVKGESVRGGRGRGIEHTFLYHLTLSKQDSPKTPNDIQ